MRLKIILPKLMLFSILLLTQTLVPVGSWTSDDEVFDDFGPRVANYVLNMYADTELLMGALQAGEIDVADLEVPGEWEEAWSLPPYSDPSSADYIKMQPAKSIGMREFDLCHKQFIDTYPSHTNPMTYQKFRQAIAHATNKPAYVAEILEGRAVVLGTPIMPWTVWYNDNCSDYYPFDLDLARAALDTANFTVIPGAGTVPGAPPGSDEWRQHPQTGVAMLPLLLYIRSEDPDRMEAGLRIAAKLKEIGIPTTDNILTMADCYEPVFVYQDYHIYTGGQTFEKDPYYLYDLYGGHAINWPNYGYYNNTDFNEAAAGVKYAENFAEALQAAKDAQMIMTDDVCNIPLWTYVAQTAHRGYAEGNTAKPWEGFVNEAGVGLHSWRSFLSAHTGDTATGGILTKGILGNIMALNPLRSNTEEEWEVLSTVYDTLLKQDPYTFEDMPWLASWYLDTFWESQELQEEITALTFNLEDDVYWHDGVHFTSADVKFSIEYQKYNQGWWWGNVMDVYDVGTPDDYTVVVIMRVKSFWALHWIGEIPILPKHIWESIQEEAIEAAMPDPYLVGTGPFKYAGGEPGSEPGTGVPPQEYIVFSAFEPASQGFFRHCPIKSLGGIILQGDHPYPTDKKIRKRTVFAPNDRNGELVYPSLNTIVPILPYCKNLHATTAPPWTGTWTLTETTGTGYSDSETITLASNPHGKPLTITFDPFDISADPNGALPYTFLATHSADYETGRTCSYTQTNLVKTFIGDINGDGYLTVWDIMVLSDVFFLWFHSGQYHANADINGDGSISVSDGIDMLYWMGQLGS